MLKVPWKDLTVCDYTVKMYYVEKRIKKYLNKFAL